MNRGFDRNMHVNTLNSHS